MNQYFFHLGRLYTLSIAELLSFFNEKDFKCINRNFALIETDISLSKDNGQNFINNIGGTKALSKLIGKVANSSEFETLASDFLIENYGSNSKIIFGLNNYINSNYAISLQNLLKKIKSSLQKQDFHCRFVNNNSNNIETPIFFKERLNSEKGSELNLIEIENEISDNQKMNYLSAISQNGKNITIFNEKNKGNNYQIKNPLYYRDDPKYFLKGEKDTILSLDNTFRLKKGKKRSYKKLKK
mgnify:CR=1 FL=1